MDGVELKIATTMSYAMDPVGVGKLPPSPVPQHGSILPARLPELVDRLHIVLGDLVTRVVALLSVMPMPRAALSRYPVTMFQPIRPLVRWSNVDMRRAKG